MSTDKIKQAEIWCADAFEKIKDIPDHSIDVILTDPPYNLAGYSRGNIKMSWRADFNNDLAEWYREVFTPGDWLAEFTRILKPTGNLFAFTSYNLLGAWHAAFDPVFDTFQFMIWHKTNLAPKPRTLSILTRMRPTLRLPGRGLRKLTIARYCRLHSLCGMQRRRNRKLPNRKLCCCRASNNVRRGAMVGSCVYAVTNRSSNCVYTAAARFRVFRFQCRLRYSMCAEITDLGEGLDAHLLQDEIMCKRFSYRRNGW